MAAIREERFSGRHLLETEVPLANGVLDIRTLGIRAYDPGEIVESVMPIAYDATARCPEWEQVLADYFDGDCDGAAKKLAIQQFFGYVLLPHARFKRALLLAGCEFGECLVRKVLAEFVGEGNWCALSTADLESARRRVRIRGMRINILPGLSIKFSYAFKQFVGSSEPLLFDPPRRPAYMYTPACKHVAVVDQMPRATSLTLPIYSRMLIVQVGGALPYWKWEEPFLSALCVGELQGILNWAIAGARSLIENCGQFVEIPESAAFLAGARCRGTGIQEFLADECQRDEGGYIPAMDLCDAFRAWAGLDYSNMLIGEIMRDAGFPRRRFRGADACRYCGLRWKEE
jgi:putative DNA primase/helicase